eukprot:jgi/Bigna1/84202/fgenesh1_pg.126_\
MATPCPPPCCSNEDLEISMNESQLDFSKLKDAMRSPDPKEHEPLMRLDEDQGNEGAIAHRFRSQGSQDRWLEKISRLLEDESKGASGWFTSITNMLSPIESGEEASNLTDKTTKEESDKENNNVSSLNSKELAVQEILKRAKEVAERESQVMESFALLNGERRKVEERQELLAKCNSLEIKLEGLKEELSITKDELKDRREFVEFLREKHEFEIGAAKRDQLRQIDEKNDQIAAISSQRDRARADGKALAELLNLESEQTKQLTSQVEIYKVKLANALRAARRRMLPKDYENFLMTVSPIRERKESKKQFGTCTNHIASSPPSLVSMETEGKQKVQGTQ